MVYVDMYDWKLNIAKKCGADICLNPNEVDLKHEIEKITDGYGCNVYFEVTGNPLSVQQGLDIITRQGRFICMSIFKKDVSADWSLIGKVFFGKLKQNIFKFELALIFGLSR